MAEKITIHAHTKILIDAQANTKDLNYDNGRWRFKTLRFWELSDAQASCYRATWHEKWNVRNQKRRNVLMK